MNGDVATGKFRLIAAKMVVQNEHPEQASTSSGSHPFCITILNGDVATGTFRPIAAELVVQNEHPEQASTSCGSHPFCITILIGDVATGTFRPIAAELVVQNEHPEQASTSCGSHPFCITILNGDVATGTFRPIAAELVVQISSDTTITQDPNRPQEPQPQEAARPVATSRLLCDAVTDNRLEDVKKILKNVNISDVNGENDKGETALEIAVVFRRKEIERVLMENPEVKHYVDALYRDRQVSVDAANAILVGAALIASITYSAWLLLPSSTDTMNATAVKAFWAFNSLSFFFAVATVVAGAYAAMPILHHEFIGRVVKRVKVKLGLASILLMLSVLCVLGAFTSGAFARLPTRITQEYKILSTAPTGLAICIIVLLLFALKLTGGSHIMSKWLKKTWVKNLLL